jgi:hypothetical protein
MGLRTIVTGDRGGGGEPSLSRAEKGMAAVSQVRCRCAAAGGPAGEKVTETHTAAVRGELWAIRGACLSSVIGTVSL